MKQKAMKQQIGRQFALALVPTKKYQPLTQRPEVVELLEGDHHVVEALADLLLEALASPLDNPCSQNGAQEAPTRTKGGEDEPKDHP